MFPSVIEWRLDETWQSLPLSIRHAPDQWGANRSSQERYDLLVMHLEYLYSRFLLLKYLTKFKPDEQEQMLSASLQLLSTALTFSAEESAYLDMQSDFASHVCDNGFSEPAQN